MQVIILGAGEVGGTLAEHLSVEHNDITLVDLNADRLKELQRKLDIRTVCGPASWPRYLEEAGIQTADLLIAVTNSDETNLVACQIASSLYQTPKRIARIRTDDYLERDMLFEEDGFAVDIRISPEQLVTTHIANLVRYPGALQVLDFFNGQLQLVAVKPFEGGMMLGKSVKAIQYLVQGIEWRITCILRRGRAVQMRETTVIESGDEVYFIAKAIDVNSILNKLGRSDDYNQRVMIAGGGNIGLRLSQQLEDRYNVKVIESDASRAQLLSEQLNRAIVLQAQATDKSLLLNENIEDTDVFCSVTNDDEANIIACLQAKKLGARQVLALINQKNYIDLVESSLIDVGVSPQSATVGSILTCIRQGDIVQVHSLRHDAAEVIEIVAHGDRKTSSVVGLKANELDIPPTAQVIAIVREDDMLIDMNGIEIEMEDRVIFLVTDKDAIKTIEKLFQVKVTFFS